jgi:hypothetical protein
MKENDYNLFNFQSKDSFKLTLEIHADLRASSPLFDRVYSPPFL